MKKQIIMAALAALVLFGSVAEAAKTLTGTVNVNTASAVELALLPGIGEARAEAIILQRKLKPFAKKEELLLIKGIGDKMFAKMQPYIAVDGTTTLTETFVADDAKSLAKPAAKP